MLSYGRLLMNFLPQRDTSHKYGRHGFAASIGRRYADSSIWNETRHGHMQTVDALFGTNHGAPIKT